jgi:hypothetical protein
MHRSVVGAAFIAMMVGAAVYALFASDVRNEVDKASSQAERRDAMPLPEYDAQGRLFRPTGFEKWVVVGTSIGLGYSDGDKTAPDHPGEFHNVYLQPQAFDHFVETGEFPEQTVFIVTNNPSRSTTEAKQSDVLRSGFFAAPSTGLEVAVKDTKRFPDGWAYFMFRDRSGREAETPFARKDCYNCHSEHGATDNVFTQYYSVLTSAREKRLKEKR